MIIDIIYFFILSFFFLTVLDSFEILISIYDIV